MLKRSPVILLLLVWAGTTVACGSDEDFKSDGGFTQDGDPGSTDRSDENFGSDDNPAFVRASDFDRSCQSGLECLLVVEQACLECTTQCAADMGSVNKRGREEFEAAKEAIECEAYSSRYCNNGFCEPAPPLCIEGQCEVWRHDRLEPLQDCSSNDECIGLYDGELLNCWSTACPTFAVNKSDWEVAAGVNCSEQEHEPRPGPDDCDGPTVPRCDDGSCVLAEQ